MSSSLSARGVSVFGVPVLCALLLSGCASDPPTFEGAFSANQQVKGTADSIAAPMDATWSATMEVLTHQGFVIQQADNANRVILATRELQEDTDEDLSYTISAALTLLPSGQSTRVMMAANQTTEMHQSEHTWWHLLWIVPIFPTGTNYTTVVVDRDTVQSQKFYSDFFDAVKASVAEMPGGSQPIAGT